MIAQSQAILGYYFLLIDLFKKFIHTLIYSVIDSFRIIISLPFCFTYTYYSIVTSRNHLNNDANSMIQINIITTFYFTIINNNSFISVFSFYLRNSYKTFFDEMTRDDIHRAYTMG